MTIGIDRPGPGSGPNGVPTAVAVSPILSARVRNQDLDRIREAAPGTRIVNLSIEGLADGPVEDVEVLLRGWLSSEAFDRLLVRAPRLRWVHSATSGVERALTPTSHDRGLTVTNARGVFTRPIAEHVLMLILAISRRLPQLLELQRERTWQPLQGVELRELTIGIIGYGSIGRAVASLAGAFGARVIALRRNPQADGEVATDQAATADSAALAADDSFPFAAAAAQVVGPGQLHDLLRASDIVVLAVPLTPETENMIDAVALAAMRRDAWIINIARGRLIDDRALIEALHAHQIGGAALDAFREQPLSPRSEFYDVPNLIITPHTAWSSARVLDRSIDLFCENLRRYSAGEPLRNVVDPRAGY
ncbi:MAG: D-2-hydroxyacid dehydrogenase [Chloroflexota bacterium]